VVTLTLLFFLLASGDLFLRRVIALVAGPHERSRAGEIAHEIEKQVSRYLYASTGINVVFGVVTGLAMHALGLPTRSCGVSSRASRPTFPYLGGLIAAASSGWRGF